VTDLQERHASDLPQRHESNLSSLCLLLVSSPSGTDCKVDAVATGRSMLALLVQKYEY
jgi:hypothetical protein